MKNIVFVLVIVLLPTLALAQTKPCTSNAVTTTAPDKPSVSEVSQLKVEILKLRAQVAQYSANLSSFTLTAEQAKLEADIKKELNAKPEDKIDWNTLSIVPPPADLPAKPIK